MRYTITIATVFLGAALVVFLSIQNPINENTVYERDMILNEYTTRNYNSSISDDRLINKSKEILSTIFDSEINFNDYVTDLPKTEQSVYRYSDEIYIRLTHKENIEDYFFISLNLNTGEILQIYASLGQEVKSGDKLSETQLEELANKYIQKLPLYNIDNYKLINKAYWEDFNANEYVFTFENKSEDSNIEISINPYNGYFISLHTLNSKLRSNPL